MRFSVTHLLSVFLACSLIGCETLESNLTEEGQIALAKAASEKSSLSNAIAKFEIGRTYTNFLVNYQPGTIALRKSGGLFVLPPGEAVPVKLDRTNRNFFFVINHRRVPRENSDPSFIAVNFIEVLAPEDPENGSIRVFRNGRGYESWETVDGSGRSLPKLSSQQAGGVTVETFPDPHRQSETVFQPVSVGNPANVWHAKLQDADTSTWGDISEKRKIWTDRLERSNLKRILRKAGVSAPDAGFSAKFHLYRFTETTKNATRSPVAADVSVGQNAVALIVQTYSPLEGYQSDYVLKFE